MKKYLSQLLIYCGVLTILSAGTYFYENFQYENSGLKTVAKIIKTKSFGGRSQKITYQYIFKNKRYTGSEFVADNTKNNAIYSMNKNIQIEILKDSPGNSRIDKNNPANIILISGILLLIAGLYIKKPPKMKLQS